MELYISSKKCLLTPIFEYFFCFTAKITLHIGGVNEEERWQAKPAAKERKVKEMGKFPGINIIPCDVYVL